MANKFWVGGGATTNWNASPTNWANSSGGAGNQTAPGTGDVAVFDSASGTANSVLNTAFTIQGLECDGSTAGTGAYGGTLTHNTSVTLTINTGAANSLRFTSGMTYTPASATSIITLTHTSGTANIKSAGKLLFALNINGAGGTTKTLDALSVTAGKDSVLTVTSGIFDANSGSGGPFTIAANKIDCSPNNTRSFILGGDVTINGNITSGATSWNAANTGTLTFTKNSANIIYSALVGATVLQTFAGGALTYNDLTLNTTSNDCLLLMTGANTFAHLTLNPGWTLGLNNVTQTITNPFTWTGTQANPVGAYVVGGAVGVLSVASGACSMTWGYLNGITGSGGATFTATNVINGGNTTGWSITPPADATLTPPAGLIAAEARGTVTTGASTTSVPTSALTFGLVAATGVVSNQFVGRALIFDGNTTTAGLRGAAVTISASSASDTPSFTVGALPATPASGDLFTVI